MAWKSNWNTGSDSEKSSLAASIISGNDSDDSTGEVLDGEWDGSLRVEDADNGVIVTHTRHIKKPGKKSSSDSKGPAEPVSESEYRDYKRVFDKNDHKGLTGHIISIIKSPRKKGSRW